MRAAMKSLSSLTADDLMSRDVTVIPSHLSLRTTARLLLQAKVSGAPVIDGSGTCVGVISATDFVHLVEDGRPARVDAPQSRNACSDWQVFDPETLPTEEVGAYMTADPVTAAPSARIGELARMMLDAHIHRIIVVDERKQPIGIVSSTDIIAAVANSAS